VDRPFLNRALLAECGVHTLSVEVDDDQVLRLKAPPTHRPGLDENSFVVQPGTQMSAQTIPRHFGRVQNPASFHQVFTKIGFKAFHQTDAGATSARAMSASWAPSANG